MRTTNSGPYTPRTMQALSTNSLRWHGTQKEEGIPQKQPQMGRHRCPINTHPAYWGTTTSFKQETDSDRDSAIYAEVESHGQRSLTPAGRRAMANGGVTSGNEGEKSPFTTKSSGQIRDTQRSKENYALKLKSQLGGQEDIYTHV